MVMEQTWLIVYEPSLEHDQKYVMIQILIQEMDVTNSVKSKHVEMESYKLRYEKNVMMVTQLTVTDVRYYVKTKHVEIDWLNELSNVMMVI